jgi:hypothetical protein
MSEFYNLSHAISYIEIETKVFYLTLGTKSDVHDLNPPIRENLEEFHLEIDPFLQLFFYLILYSYFHKNILLKRLKSIITS